MRKKPALPAQLYKITEMRDGCVWNTQMMGFYLLRCGLDDDRKREIAKELGGDDWASVGANNPIWKIHCTATIEEGVDYKEI